MSGISPTRPVNETVTGKTSNSHFAGCIKNTFIVHCIMKPCHSDRVRDRRRGQLRTSTFTFKLTWSCLLGTLFVISPTLKGQPGATETVLMTAESRTSPQPRIELRFPVPNNPSAEVQGNVVYRKTLDAAECGATLAKLDANVEHYQDDQVEVGRPYEYRVIRNSQGIPGKTYGFLHSGIELPFPHVRGTLLLLVAQPLVKDLSEEIDRLEWDLVGDGWTVVRHEIQPDSSPVAVRDLIRQDYLGNPEEVNAVYLLGNLPVPYSGNNVFDGHPEHQGAWPADVYYGEMTSVWTDEKVDTRKSSTPPAREANKNIPGDGKFDPSQTPSEVELMVGRVDLSDMPAFADPETELLRRYLGKNHSYRHGDLTFQPRALVDSQDWIYLGRTWRNLTAFFGLGPDNVRSGDWFTILSDPDYSVAHAFGAGTFTRIQGVGTTEDFAKRDAQVAFALLFGSFFGDWDNEDNVLRAPLGNRHTLGVYWANSYTHGPYLQHFAMGKPIGYSIRVCQNDPTLYAFNPAATPQRPLPSALMYRSSRSLGTPGPVSNRSISRRRLWIVSVSPLEAASSRTASESSVLIAYCWGVDSKSRLAVIVSRE
jgi:hypothetical protein